MPANIQTDASLLQRLQEASKRDMTAAEIRNQRISFVYGNMPHDAGVTKPMVAKILARLDGTSI